MYFRVESPIVGIRRRSLGTDRNGCAKIQRGENGIENMAAHITERTGAEIEPLPPISRVVIRVPDKRPLRTWAKPEIPIETRGHGVYTVGLRSGVSPGLRTPGVHFLNLSDSAGFGNNGSRPIVRMRVDLN